MKKKIEPLEVGDITDAWIEPGLVQLAEKINEIIAVLEEMRNAKD